MYGQYCYTQIHNVLMTTKKKTVKYVLAVKEIFKKKNCTSQRAWDAIEDSEMLLLVMLKTMVMLKPLFYSRESSKMVWSDSLQCLQQKVGTLFPLFFLSSEEEEHQWK